MKGKMHSPRLRSIYHRHKYHVLPAICASTARSPSMPHAALFPRTCQRLYLEQLGSSLATVLDGSITVNAAGSLSRTSGTKRPYSMVKRKAKVDTENQTPKKPLPSIESLCDGSHFDASRPKNSSSSALVAEPLELEDQNKHSCCKHRCNEQWDAEAFGRTRCQLERYGKGTQKVRKVFVRDSLEAGTNHLHIRDGMHGLRVCCRFYSALMGVSFNLIRSAAMVGCVQT